MRVCSVTVRVLIVYSTGLLCDSADFLIVYSTGLLCDSADFLIVYSAGLLCDSAGFFNSLQYGFVV